jgi:hypothetical protein
VNSAAVGVANPSFAAEFQIDQRDAFIASRTYFFLALNIMAQQFLDAVSGPE